MMTQLVALGRSQVFQKSKQCNGMLMNTYRSLCQSGGNLLGRNPLSPMATPVGNQTLLTNALNSPSVMGYQPVRTNVRKHFDRPNELRRVVRHGWKARMSTPGGRQIIMRRMLKGRHCLTH